MSRSYGICYLGSKSKITCDLFEYLPAGARFVDLFGGGGAMSHYAYLTNRYNKVLYNEIDADLCNIIRQITSTAEPPFKWISRKEFQAPTCSFFYKLLFCFSGSLKDYFCAKENDFFYYELFEIIVNNNYKNNLAIFLLQLNPAIFDNFAFLDYTARYTLLADTMGVDRRRCCLRPYENYRRLSNMHNINIEINNGSYLDYKYKEGDVVYCDPPYADTNQKGYRNKFDSNNFIEWALTRDYPVYISSYELPKSFYLIYEKPFLNNYRKSVTERLYCNKPVYISKQLYLDLEG